MRLSIPLTAFASLLVFGTVAQADILASGPIYGGTNGVGGEVTCRIQNVGISVVSVVTRQIINNGGGFAPLASDSCTAGVAPNGYCAFNTIGGGNLAYSCKAVIFGIDPNVRGTAEFTKSGAILNSLPMTK